MPILLEPKVKEMKETLLSLVPEREWGIWLNEYDYVDIHFAFTTLARYFVDDAQFDELPKSHEFQIKGRVSQTLYILNRVGFLSVG